MNAVKNIVIGLVVLAGLAVSGFLFYVAGSMVVAILGMVVSVVVAVAPFVLAAASVIFMVFGGAYTLGKSIMEGGVDHGLQIPDSSHRLLATSMPTERSTISRIIDGKACGLDLVRRPPDREG